MKNNIKSSRFNLDDYLQRPPVVKDAEFEIVAIDDTTTPVAALSPTRIITGNAKQNITDILTAQNPKTKYFCQTEEGGFEPAEGAERYSSVLGRNTKVMFI